MPVLIDGYNLYHYVRNLYQQQQQVELGLIAFCKLIEAWAARAKEKTTIIFDGTLPVEMKYEYPKLAYVKLVYSGHKQSADALIEQRIRESSAPKLLTVVSSDREILSIANKRKCKSITSQDYWTVVAKKLTRKKRTPMPREKQKGLSSDELDYWVKIFKIE